MTETLPVIRIHEHEYVEIAGARLMHFNLAPAHHEVGTAYALPRIVRAGDDDVGALPTLSFENCFVGDCIAFRRRVDYEDLAAPDFEHSMSGVKDVVALRSRMLDRYRRSRSGMSDEDILARGISLTLLALRPRR